MDKCGLLARLVPSADRGLVFGTLAFGTDTCNIWAQGARAGDPLFLSVEQQRSPGVRSVNR